MDRQEASTSQRIVTIREATPADRRSIERLRAAVGWSPIGTGLQAMAEGRAIVYVMETESTAIASVSLSLRSEDPALADGLRVAHLSNLIVHPEYQGQGMGTRLVAFIEDEARLRGYSYLTIGVDVPNVRARQLYERTGFSWLKDVAEPWGPVHYLCKQL